MQAWCTVTCEIPRFSVHKSTVHSRPSMLIAEPGAFLPGRSSVLAKNSMSDSATSKILPFFMLARVSLSITITISSPSTLWVSPKSSSCINTRSMSDAMSSFSVLLNRIHCPEGRRLFAVVLEIIVQQLDYLSFSAHFLSVKSIRSSESLQLRQLHFFAVFRLLFLAVLVVLSGRLRFLLRYD